VVEDPEGFRAVLSAHGIQTGVHYPYTLPDVVYGSCSSGMAHSTYISKHVVTLPIHPGLDYLDLVHVSQVIHQSFETDDISKLWRLKDD
jgi:dTDP-4-amino-4,6-dideoxygalactose transaminase